ncbi:MAG: hypothetical protein K5918_04525 [Bacteroidales bacterium]|nr:hypothetical protein [Bacteroidales bacterium]
MKKKKKLTNNDILNTIERLGLQAQLCAPQQTLVDGLLHNVGRRCATERQQYAIRTTAQHLAVRTLSLTITAFCLTLTLHSDPRCGYVVDGKLINHTETLNQIDKLFLK